MELFHRSIHLDLYSSEMLIIKQEASPRASAAQQVSDPRLSRQGGWEGIYSRCNVLSLNIVPQDKSSLSLPSSQQPQLLLSASSLTRDDTVTAWWGPLLVPVP